MKLHSIKIQNYRGIIEEQEIRFSNLTTLVGRNDSGKSIILNALNLYLNDEKIEKKDFNNQSSGSPVISCVWKTDEDEIINLIAGEKSEGYDSYKDAITFPNRLIEIKKNYEKEGKKVSSIKIKIKDFQDDKYQNLWGEKSSKINFWVENLGIDVPSSGKGKNSDAEKIKYIREKLKEKHSVEEIYVEDTYEIHSNLPDFEFFSCEETIDIDISFRNNLRNHTKDIFEDKDQSINEIEASVSQKMNEEAETIYSFMKEHASSLERVEIIPEFDWVKGINNVEVMFKFKNDNSPIQMANKGAGYRRLFMVGHFQYLAKKSNNDNTVYAIEEPETFLHPIAQEDFLNSLITLSEQNQIILTSHSPIFAGGSHRDSIVLVKRKFKGNKASSIYEQKENNVGEIIEELGIKPSINLQDNFEVIIFMESLNDIDFIKVAAKKLELDEFDDKFLFLPGGGASLSNFVDIKYFSDQKRPLFLIVDSDKNQNTNDAYKKNEKLIKEFNEKGNQYCGLMLQKAEIENYQHPSAIARVHELNEDIINNGELFSDTDEVWCILKQLKADNNKNFKKKIDLKVLKEMTSAEWKEVSDGELEDIISKILNALE